MCRCSAFAALLPVLYFPVSSLFLFSFASLPPLRPLSSSCVPLMQVPTFLSPSLSPSPCVVFLHPLYSRGVCVAPARKGSALRPTIRHILLQHRGRPSSSLASTAGGLVGQPRRPWLVYGRRGVGRAWGRGFWEGGGCGNWDRVLGVILGSRECEGWRNLGALVRVGWEKGWCRRGAYDLGV